MFTCSPSYYCDEAVSSVYKIINPIYNNTANNTKIFISSAHAPSIKTFCRDNDIKIIINCALEIFLIDKSIKCYTIEDCNHSILYSINELTVIEAKFRDNVKSDFEVLFNDLADIIFILGDILRHNILILCHMGVSRSASAFLSYMIKYKRVQNINECIEQMKKNRPVINPSKYFLNVLYDYMKRKLEFSLSVSEFKSKRNVEVRYKIIDRNGKELINDNISLSYGDQIIEFKKDLIDKNIIFGSEDKAFKLLDEYLFVKLFRQLKQEPSNLKFNNKETIDFISKKLPTVYSYLFN